ncbi:hypothetical protein B0H14DRAFT_3523138 [Mycena olivaceomarginata]|nr:hypothetical protein B0H14DRAFT_3523138 [Mycena olivaceomarginata]
MFRKWLPADSHARNVTFSAHRTPLAPVSQILDDEDHSGPSPLDPGSQTALCFKLARLPDAYHSCIASFSDTRYHNLYSVRYPEMPLAYLEAKPSVIISCISLTLYSSFFSVGLWLSAAILFTWSLFRCSGRWRATTALIRSCLSDMTVAISDYIVSSLKLLSWSFALHVWCAYIQFSDTRPSSLSNALLVSDLKPGTSSVHAIYKPRKSPLQLMLTPGSFLLGGDRFRAGSHPPPAGPTAQVCLLSQEQSRLPNHAIYPQASLRQQHTYRAAGSGPTKKPV